MAAWPPAPGVPTALSALPALESIVPIDLVSPSPANRQPAALSVATELERAAVNGSITLLNQVLDFFVARSGASATMFMRGALNLNGNLVTDLSDGVAVADLCTKGQVDAVDVARAAALAPFTAQEILLHDGSLAMQADLGAGAVRVKQLPLTPSLSTDGASKAYTDTAFTVATLSSTYLRKAPFAAMSGVLDMGGFVIGNLAGAVASDYAVTKLASDLAVAAISPVPEPIGLVRPWCGGTPPEGWFLCDGSLYDEVERWELFNVIGRTYGGSAGASTFAVPDLRGYLVSMVDPGFPSFQNRLRSAWLIGGPVPNSWAGALGGAGGVEVFALDDPVYLPLHAHSVTNVLGGKGVTTGVYWGATVAAGAATFEAALTGSFNTDNRGSNTPHPNVQPTMALDWIIKALTV